MALIAAVDDAAEGAGAAATHDRICCESCCELLLYLRGRGRPAAGAVSGRHVPRAGVSRWTTGGGAGHARKMRLKTVEFAAEMASAVVETVARGLQRGDASGLQRT
jgi:hypothetical protein